MGTENIIILDKYILTIDRGQFPFQNKYGLVDNAGKEILKTEYHAIWEIAKGLIGYRYGIVFGLLNANGEIIIEPCLEGFREFEYKEKERCSFVEDILKPESHEEDYEYLTYDENITHKPLLLNSSGEIISKFEFDWIGHVFPRGQGKVIANGKAGIYNFKLKQYEVQPIYHDEELYLSEKGDIIYGGWPFDNFGYSLIEKVKKDRAQFSKKPLEFSIFFSPLRLFPKLMIIGDNPGGQMDQPGLYEIPKEHEYIYIDQKDDYKMAKMMRDKIMKGEILHKILKDSVKTNRIFFRTPDLDTLDSLENKNEIIEYCKNILHEIIRTIQPRNILAESFGTFRSLSNVETTILMKPNSTKPLLLLGQFEGIRVFGINHPSKASYHKINDDDWDSVNRELEKSLQ